MDTPALLGELCRGIVIEKLSFFLMFPLDKQMSV